MANWKAELYTWTCGIDLVFINEREEISGIDRGAHYTVTSLVTSLVTSISLVTGE